MKRLLLIAFTALSIHVIAQTNSYPTTGDVTIYNYSPSLVLQRNTDIGGFTEGIQTKLQDGTDNWFFGALLTGQWIVSKGNHSNPKMTILDNGYVGIGTTNPQTLLNVNVGAGGSNGLAGVRIGGLGNYESLELGIDGDYDGMIRCYGNNLNYYAGHWKVKGTIATENHSHNWYTSKAGSTNWSIIKMTLNQDGNLGIGTQNPAYKLDVLGTIRAKEVLVNLDGGADFVFEKDYKLPTIEHVATYVQENKHLPDIPSASEMTKNGVSMGDMQVKLLQKVEELTLYAIQQDKGKIELERKYNVLLEKVEMLTKQLEKK